MKKLLLLSFLLAFGLTNVKAQCGSTGDEVSYGNGSWIGYVYQAQNNFNTANYAGFITESETFNTSFGNGNVITSDCNFTPNNFSVRFKMQKVFACGEYTFTIGGDDGVRLSIDGGSTFIINEWRAQAYKTFNKTFFLNGNGGTPYDLVLEYYEASGDEQVSFNYVVNGIGGSAPGVIGESQIYCSTTGAVDPDPIVNISDGGFCSGGSINYQWEISSDNSTFTSISGETGSAYDPPSGFALGITRYYRRKVTNGTDSAYSNTVSIANSNAPGDPNVFGNEEWLGYVYDGANNFNSADYKGTTTESERFDQNFGGNNTNIPINGCPVVSETFTVRYKMRKFFTHGIYEFTIGADDGVRLSLDGGSTYLITDWSNHGYRTNNNTVTLNGTYDLVLDYYENGGGNRVTFTYTLQTPLPVELVTFEGESSGDYVDLFWVTASEINNDFFTIEKATQNEEFSILKTIKGAGTTNVQQVYEATDNSTCKGICYYRLKQTDFDGKTTTYDPISVVSEIEEDNLQEVILYPNPLKDNKVNIEIPGFKSEEMELFMNDLYGKKFITDITLIELPTKSIISLEFNNGIPKGVYMISIIVNNELISKKLYVE